ncbi:MAG: hypothetical protein Kow0037_04490 [Calditrichia bacterium]
MKRGKQSNDQTNLLKEHQTLRQKWAAAEPASLGVRQLFPEEISQLEKQGNYSKDWSLIWVSKNFNPDSVVGNLFLGRNVIEGSSEEKNQVGTDSLPTGIYHSTLRNVWISRGAVIHRVQWLHDCFVGEFARLINVQEAGGAPDSRFFTENPVTVGMETGGREIYLLPDIDFVKAAELATNRGNSDLQNRHRELAENYQKEYLLPFTKIGAYCRVENIISLKKSILDAGTHVADGVLLEHCFTRCSPEEPVKINGGSEVRHSLLQFGAHVSGGAYISGSLLCEHSEVERHGMVVSSILAPNCSIAEGEVTSSLVGPFVAAHHQSLLIAAIWPEGKGNIGYGANVGSNHTGKAPDQEIWAGEGVFYGLGVNIKFPSNFQDAPYSIIATAVDTLPQKVDFPFSLINKPNSVPEGISPAFNEIAPAWVLSDNLYAIIRNEKKYTRRNKATHTSIETRIFRPDVVDRMWKAAQQLEIKDDNQLREFYTEKQIGGLGKNFLRERARREAVRTYRYFCKYYVLKGLWEAVRNRGQIPDWDTLFGWESGTDFWAHQKSYILEKRFEWNNPADALREYADMLRSIGERLLNSKKKDDGRGMRIIPDYAVAATRAEDDSFIRETLAEFEEEIQQIKKLL